MIRGLSALNQPCNVDLYSDSKYVIDALEKGWAVGWRKRGWKRQTKSPPSILISGLSYWICANATPSSSTGSRGTPKTLTTTAATSLLSRNGNASKLIQGLCP